MLGFYARMIEDKMVRTNAWKAEQKKEEKKLSRNADSNTEILEALVAVRLRRKAEAGFAEETLVSYLDPNAMQEVNARFHML